MHHIGQMPGEFVGLFAVEFGNLAGHGFLGLAERALGQPFHAGRFLADLFANVVFWTFSAMVASGFEAWTVAIFFGTCLFQTIVDGFYVRLIRGTPMPLRFLMLVPLKSLCMVAIWAHACFSRSVVWRGRRLRFGRQSRLRDDEGNLGERISRSIRAAIG